MHDIGSLGGFSKALAVNADGSIVAGFSNPTGTFENHAFMWTESSGMVDLNTFLPTLGVDLSGWTLTEASGLSADGSAITGYGAFNGQEMAFR